MADVLLYLVLLADVLDIDLADAARRKLAAADSPVPARLTVTGQRAPGTAAQAGAGPAAAEQATMVA